MAEEKHGFFHNIASFTGEVKQEVRKVTWPTRSEMYGGTIVIIFVTILVCAALGGVDALFSGIMEMIMSR
jgi:preprotein translocase subunit SecE